MKVNNLAYLDTVSKHPVSPIYLLTGVNWLNSCLNYVVDVEMTNGYTLKLV